MIEKAEIEAKAKEFEIHTSNVQRDYVFGWLLFGIFTLSDLKDRIFLKGGNALRKGYFENTRYSTDLDFGIPDDIDPTFLLEEINKVCDSIQEKAGIIFAKEKNEVDEKFPPGENSPLPDLRVFEVNIFFKDFYGNPEKFTLKISMDLTRFDRTIYPPVRVPLIHPYSDASEVACEIQCMKLEEIIATKLKCMMQRQNAPDLFDYVYSIQLLGGNLNKNEVREAFIQKTIFEQNPYILKGILGATDFDFFRSTWVKSIVCAKKYMMQVEDAISAFISDLEDLFAGISDNGYTQFVFFPVEARSKILKAGRTKTTLDVCYKGEQRIIEPYALKYQQPKNSSAREYLYVYNSRGGSNPPGWRQFVAQNLQTIENTEEAFEPRFPIELSKSGEMPEKHFLFDSNKPARAPRGTRKVFSSRPRTSYSTNSGPRYIFKCSNCGKQSRRTSYDSSQYAHKDKNGYDCYGYPIYIDTKY